jgi:hypothetical protein
LHLAVSDEQKGSDMDVTVAFKNAKALEGIQPALERYEQGDTLPMREIRLALGTISQALEDGLEALNELPSELAMTNETVENALRLSFGYTDSALQMTADKEVLVVAKTDPGYLVAVPNPNWSGGLLVVLGKVSENHRAWTITQSLLSGRPLN